MKIILSMSLRIMVIALMLISISGCSGSSSDNETSGDNDSTEYSDNTANDDNSSDNDSAEISDNTEDEGNSNVNVSTKSMSYVVVDTGQVTCYDDSAEITCPAEGEAFYGQDAQHVGHQASYTNNGDGTVTDNVTGLLWQQSPDTDGDGDIDAADKLTYDEAVAGASEQTTGGYNDWRLPTIKELYSLMDFSGVDPSGYEGTDTSGLIPFINTDYFDFAYGDTSARERVIDSQYASSTLYVANTAGDRGRTLFGVNFADGRIKGYGLTMPGSSSEKTFFVMYVRGNTKYGQNDFADNGDGTITDSATGLMWSQDDSGSGLDWEAALAWVEAKNNATYLGYSDWRLPNVKELQSIVDYTCSPGTTGSAAIDPMFNATSIINEAEQTDYSCYWSCTTHANWSETSGGSAGAYVAFGRAMGYMNGAWTDVHGAGAQRSDPKAGDPADFPTGRGPQGDAIRVYNYVRLVRDADTAQTSEDTTYNLLDTGQAACYGDNGNEIICPESGESFYGQDAQFTGNQFSYTDNGDGTVTDNVTGLVWQQIPANTGLNYADAEAYCESLELAGYDDWRIPTTKELFSISNFSEGWPYLDTTYLSIGGTAVSKDEQYWTEAYVGTTVEGGSNAAFGVNHGTGHIKAYPGGSSGRMGNYVRAVRGNTSYGVNNFEDNGDGTITDHATGLMWQQADSGEGMDWEAALAYAESATVSGHDDWRLPNVKELQSIVDYTHSPSASDAAKLGPAIDTDYFEITELPSETTNYSPDYGYFWTSTSAYFGTDSPDYYYAWYVAFGTTAGNDGADFHGAGAVRFDTKYEGNEMEAGHDERVYNYVRLVRNTGIAQTSDGATENSDNTDNDDNSNDSYITLEYNIVDTGQNKCFDKDGNEITPVEGEEYFGQDAQYAGTESSYTDNGDGIITDNVTGLMWEQKPDSGKVSWSDAKTYCENLEYAGYDDWRLPTIKELFALSDFSEGWPYIDTEYFKFAESEGSMPPPYGAGGPQGGNGTPQSEDNDQQPQPPTNTGDDSDDGSITKPQGQFWTSNFYQLSIENLGIDSAFGVNHATGHIKAYPCEADQIMGKYVRAVRGNLYGVNDFVDNGDSTITDNATGLMWAQSDSESGMDWETALAYAEDSSYAGYDDWRLPNVKELQSIVDYSGVFPAIDPIFMITGITNEAGNADYPYFWTSTSAGSTAASDYYYAWYVAFGYAVGPDGNDTHGAGAVRFDTKVEGGTAGEDEERGYNYVRLVRDAN